MPWDIFDCIFSKVLFQLHLPTLPKDYASLSNAIRDAGFILLSTFFFESNIILMTLMVVYSYLIRKNTYKYQKPSFETLANFELNQHLVGLKKKKAAIWTHDLLTNTFLQREGEERETNAAFLHWPQSANFTKGYIKSKHAMVVLKLLLQYNNEVNSN